MLAAIESGERARYEELRARQDHQEADEQEHEI